jgi:hypothetical protein
MSDSSIQAERWMKKAKGDDERKRESDPREMNATRGQRPRVLALLDFGGP